MASDIHSIPTGAIRIVTAKLANGDLIMLAEMFMLRLETASRNVDALSRPNGHRRFVPYQVERQGKAFAEIVAAAGEKPRARGVAVGRWKVLCCSSQPADHARQLTTGNGWLTPPRHRAA